MNLLIFFHSNEQLDFEAIEELVEDLKETLKSLKEIKI